MGVGINGETRLFPIIGDPIVYAKSPDFFSHSLARRGANAICVPMQVPAGKLDLVMAALSAMPNVDGILVTMPHKNDVTRHCATLSRTSRLLGTASVIRRNPDGTWHGDTQDGTSFVKAQIDHGAQVEGARVLLLGAGGAGSAIAIALMEHGPRELVVSDIDPGRAARLVGLLADDRARVGPPDPTGCDLVCNATPMGMAQDDPLPVAADLLAPSMFVGDVIAGHGLTPLLAAARAAGCRIANGDQMVEAVQEMMLDYMLHADAR